MSKKLAEIKKLIVDLISDSTIHGLPKVFKSKTIAIKFIWSVCFLFCGFFCGLMVFKTIELYLDFQVVTNIKTITQIPAVFPVVTLCNMNQFNNNDSFELVKLFSSLNLRTAETKVLLLNKYTEYNDTIKRSITHDLNETLIKCVMNGKDCNASVFEWIFLPFPNGGNCFQFNTGKNSINKNQSQSGSANGLRLELFLGDPDFTPPFIYTSGYNIMISNQSSDINFFEGYSVAPGMETNIILNRVYTSLKPHPYNECINSDFDSDLYRTLIKSNKTYRQAECYNLCLQKLIIERCKCYTNSFNSLGSQKSCQNVTEMKCLIKVWEEFEAKDVKSFCSPYCPLECESMSFQSTISFSQYPTKSYAEAELMKNPLIKSKLSNERINFELIKQVVLSVNVHYDQLGYTAITQDAKTEIFDLVSNLGGLFGLFLGGSFLSCIEIIEILIELIYILLTRAKISLNDLNDTPANKVSKGSTSTSNNLGSRILNASNMDEELMSKNITLNSLKYLPKGY